MKAVWLVLSAALLSVGLNLNPAHSRVLRSTWGARDLDFSSTREVQRFVVQPNAAVWAVTSGGVLRFENGNWTKFAFAPPTVAEQNSALAWKGQRVVARFDSLKIGEKTLPMPPSSGTHFSALLPRGDALWAAIFGDGIWAWNGTKWSRPALGLPVQAREITALCQSSDGKTVFVGTRREGVWTLAKGKWQQHLEPDEPFASNIQFLQTFRGALWASTLEDGLVVRDAGGWKHIERGDLSSNAPRQMAVFRGKLYVRHSNEVVDQFDGKTWKQNVFPILPRKQIISLAADESRLYLGQWGGWSEWDGRTFIHHLRLPELQIVPLQQIFPDAGSVWLGTENRGLFRWNRRAQKLERFDERNGLPQDWISAVNRTRNTVVAGTFGAGFAWRTDGETTWHSATQLSSRGVSALAPDDVNRVWIGTRSGLSVRDQNGDVKSCDVGAPREIQSLKWTRDGLWIGTRNELSFRARATLNGLIP